MSDNTNGNSDAKQNHDHFSEDEIEEFRELLLEKKEQITDELQGLRKKIRKGVEKGSSDRSGGEPDSDFVTESSSSSSLS